MLELVYDTPLTLNCPSKGCVTLDVVCEITTGGSSRLLKATSISEDGQLTTLLMALTVEAVYEDTCVLTLVPGTQLVFPTGTTKEKHLLMFHQVLLQETPPSTGRYQALSMFTRCLQKSQISISTLVSPNNYVNDRPQETGGHRKRSWLVMTVLKYRFLLQCRKKSTLLSQLEALSQLST